MKKLTRSVYLLFFRFFSYVGDCAFQQICNDLVELRSILRCNNWNTCALLNCFSCNSCCFASLAGNCYIL